MGKRGRDVVWWKTRPQHGEPQVRVISQIQSVSLMSEEFEPQIRHLNIQTWTREEPLKHLVLKTNRAYVQET